MILPEGTFHPDKEGYLRVDRAVKPAVLGDGVYMPRVWQKRTACDQRRSASMKKLMWALYMCLAILAAPNLISAQQMSNTPSSGSTRQN
jgi:hypothetical protein